MGKNSLSILACLFLFAAAASAKSPFIAEPANVNELQLALEYLRQANFPDAEGKAMDLAAKAEICQGRSWLIVAAARQEAQQFNGAIKAYWLYLASNPASELRQYVLQQIALCERTINQESLPALPSKALSEAELQELSKVDDAFYTESSKHFTIRSRNAKLSKLLVSQCENSLARVSAKVLGKEEFEHNVEVHVWKDSQEFQNHAADAPAWAEGTSTLTSDSGKVTRRIDLTQLDRSGKFAGVMLDRVLPHELCHIVTREFFGEVACPLVLSEGLAMLCEWQVDNDRVILAGSALASTQSIPLESLLTHQLDANAEPDVFYAESFSFLDFLQSRLSPQQFRDFLEQMRAGCTVSDALQRALYISHTDTFLAMVENNWQDKAIQQAQVARMLRTQLAANLVKNPR